MQEEPAAGESEQQVADDAASTKCVEQDASSTGDSFYTDFYAGGGVGWKSLQLPSGLGYQKLSADLFPVVDLGLGFVISQKRVDVLAVARL